MKLLARITLSQTVALFAERKYIKLSARCTDAEIISSSNHLIIPGLINANTIWLDVGTTAIEIAGKRKLLVHVDCDDGQDIAPTISPVPSGVGPMTIACLMKNTLIAAEAQTSKE